MRLIRKILRSRVVWCLIGIFLGVCVIPKIPAGSIGDILKFLWAQKWGIIIGAVIIAIVSFVKRNGTKYKIVRTDDEPESRR